MGSGSKVASVSRLFRWIVTVGGVSDPTSLTQFTEAVRWNLTSGFGVALSESGRPNGRSEDEESAYPGHETSGVRQKITTREQRFTVQHGSGLLFQKTVPGSLDQDTGRGFLGRSS